MDAMKAVIENIQYHPNAESVAVLVKNPLSSFFVNLAQSDLAFAAGGVWDDEHVLAAVRVKIAEMFPAIDWEVALNTPAPPPGAPPTLRLVAGDEPEGAGVQPPAS